MGWNIRRKLQVLGIGPIVVTMLVCVVGIQGLREVGGRVSALNVASKAIQSHMQADMMHDALRGDVFAALQAQSAAELRQARADVEEHAASFRDALAANEGRHLGAEFDRAFADTRPALDAYVESAQAIVDAAGRDHAQAQSRLPGFLAAFKDLEGRMEQLRPGRSVA